MKTISKTYDKDQVDRAEDIAIQTHFWQQRRGGQSYAAHLKRVQIRAKSLGYKKRIQILCILHDAIEDGIHPEHVKKVIRKNINNPEQIINDLELLTHSEGQDYSKYVLNIYHKSVDAFAVKLCDMVDNISDNPTEKQFKKYRDAIIYLLHNGVPVNKIPKQIFNILKLK